MGIFLACLKLARGSRDSAVVRALATHLCGPGSIPGLGVICGLSLLLVLFLAPRFFLRFSGFPPFTKTNTFKFQFDQGRNDNLWDTSNCVTLQKSVFFVVFISILARTRNASHEGEDIISKLR